MNEPEKFFDLYRQGFARVAVAVPRCRVADPAFNAGQTIALLHEAERAGAAVVVFPELGLSAYTCDDLFHQRALLDACEAALAQVLAASEGIAAVAVVGLPLRVDHSLFNCAVVMHRGRLLGIVPKTYLPNYGEFYEARQFNAGRPRAVAHDITLLGARRCLSAPICCSKHTTCRLGSHVEICEDVWVPIPPSSSAALAGATVLLNLSASQHHDRQGRTTGMLLAAAQSVRCLAAYLYSSAGQGESTTDLSWDGQTMIYENGALLAETERFPDDSHLIIADVDLDRLRASACARPPSTTTGGAPCATRLARFRRVPFTLAAARRAHALRRRVDRFPYVPADRHAARPGCYEVYSIQVQGLDAAAAASGIHKLVIGVSGGLDSTHALLVCARAMDRMGRPRSDILAYTMPGFATGDAHARPGLAPDGIDRREAREIDIRPSCEQMLKDLGHPYAQGEPEYDITFENVQAGERTNHLFRLANFNEALRRRHRRPVASWRWAGAPTAWATTCATTTSTPACPRR